MKHAAGADVFNLAPKTDFIALKVEVRQFDIGKLVHVPSGLNNLKNKADDSDIVELKAVSVDLTKLSDAIDKDVAERTK